MKEKWPFHVTLKEKFLPHEKAHRSGGHPGGGDHRDPTQQSTYLART